MILFILMLICSIKIFSITILVNNEAVLFIKPDIQEVIHPAEVHVNVMVHLEDRNLAAYGIEIEFDNKIIKAKPKAEIRIASSLY